MILHHILIRDYTECIEDKVAVCMANMYYWHLGELETKTFVRLNITLTDKQKPNCIDRYFRAYVVFDFDGYLRLSSYAKKKKILDVVHNTLMNVSEEEGINQQQLIDTYNKCMELNLEHKFLLRRPKPLRSPNHQYFGNVECFWDVDIFIATAIIYNKQGEEIMRKIIGIEQSGWGHFIYWAEMKWENGYFFLRGKQWFESENRNWCIKVYTPDKKNQPTINTKRKKKKLLYGWENKHFFPSYESAWIYPRFYSIIQNSEYTLLKDQAYCIADMYVQHLGPIKTCFLDYVDIIFKNEEDFNKTVSRKQARDSELGIATIKGLIDVYVEPWLKSRNRTIYTTFNFNQYWAGTPYEKKKMLLDTIHKCLSAISKKEGIDPKKLEKAYQSCLSHKLINRFPFKGGEDEILLSPNQQYFGRVELLWEADTITAIAIIQDREEKEIIRKIIGKQQANRRKFYVFTSGLSKIKWEEGYFCLEMGKDWTKEDHGILRWCVKVYTPNPKAEIKKKKK